MGDVGVAAYNRGVERFMGHIGSLANVSTVRVHMNAILEMSKDNMSWLEQVKRDFAALTKHDALLPSTPGLKRKRRTKRTTRLEQTRNAEPEPRLSTRPRRQASDMALVRMSRVRELESATKLRQPSEEELRSSHVKQPLEELDEADAEVEKVVPAKKAKVSPPSPEQSPPMRMTRSRMRKPEAIAIPNQNQPSGSKLTPPMHVPASHKTATAEKVTPTQPPPKLSPGSVKAKVAAYEEAVQSGVASEPRLSSSRLSVGQRLARKSIARAKQVLRVAKVPKKRVGDPSPAIQERIKRLKTRTLSNNAKMKDTPGKLIAWEEREAEARRKKEELQKRKAEEMRLRNEADAQRAMRARKHQETKQKEARDAFEAKEAEAQKKVATPVAMRKALLKQQHSKKVNQKTGVIVEEEPPAETPPVVAAENADATFTKAANSTFTMDTTVTKDSANPVTKSTAMKDANSTFTLDANSTFTKEAPASYQVTPTRDELPAPRRPSGDKANNYDIADIASDDSTDDEDQPKKYVPEWASGKWLDKVLVAQQVIGAEDIFGPPPQTFRLEEIFGKGKGYMKRTSSAVWNN